MDIDEPFYRLKNLWYRKSSDTCKAIQLMKKKEKRKHQASYFLFLCKDQTSPHRGREAKRHRSNNKTKKKENERTTQLEVQRFKKTTK